MKKLFCLFFLLLALSGCASILSSFSSRMADDLADAILNSGDIETVREGIPAYLLLMDGLLNSSPDNVELLFAAARLNSSYSIYTDIARAKLLNQKSFDLAMRAVCLSRSVLCDAHSIKFEDFSEGVERLESKDLEVAYQLSVSWVSWIQANSDDWNAIGQLGRVKALMMKLIDLDETWDAGGPHLYMGALETLFPAAMGGRPEKGKYHLERAISLSGGKYLMAQVIYAEQYARLVFDKELHDRLLREVIESDPIVEGMTLTNLLAQERAKVLLRESNEYF